MDAERSVTVLLPNGVRITKTIAAASTLVELIDLVSSDPEYPFPGRDVRLMYLGRTLSPTDVIGQICEEREYTIQCFGQTTNQQAPVDDVVRGFDRLGRVGYTPGQIQEVREMFHRVRQTNRLSREQQLEIEDEWVPALTMFNGQIDVIQALENDVRPARSSTDTIIPVAVLRPEIEEADSPLLSQSEEGDGGSNHRNSWIPFIVGFLIGVFSRFIVPILPVCLISASCIDTTIFIGMLFGIGLCWVL